MRTDIERIGEATKEMRLNDRLYNEMREELDREIEYIAEFEPELLYNEFETLYFWRRVLSVLENHDLPFQCAVGLSFYRDRKSTRLNSSHAR